MKMKAAFVVMVMMLASVVSYAADRDFQVTAEGKVRFEQRWTMVPAVICPPGVECPKSEPYWVVVVDVEKSDNERKIETLYLESATSKIGVLRKPERIWVGNVTVKEKETIRIEATAWAFSDDSAYVRRVHEIDILDEVRFGGINIWHCRDLGMIMDAGIDIAIKKTQAGRTIMDARRITIAGLMKWFNTEVVENLVADGVSTYTALLPNNTNVSLSVVLNPTIPQDKANASFVYGRETFQLHCTAVR